MHTPTPWKVVHGTEDKLSVRSEDKQICTVVFSQPTAEQMDNAAFIVKAVNNHEALLNALKGALTVYESGFDDLGSWAIIAKEAIANAEKES